MNRHRVGEWTCDVCLWRMVEPRAWAADGVDTVVVCVYGGW